MSSLTLGPGLTFDLRTAGDPKGPLVLFLHGFPATSRSWESVMKEMENDGYFFVAPDQRGYSPGARPAAIADYATDLLVADAIGIARALGHSRFHLVGHDWGASVAWALAAQHPEVVRTLTAVSVPHLAAYGLALREDPDQQARGAYIKMFRTKEAESKLLADDARGLNEFYGSLLPADLRADYRAHMESGALTPGLNWYRAMRSDLGALPAVTMPTTYVWSNQDAALARFGAERCGEHVKADYEFIELTTDHWIPENEPAALVKAIRARIASVPG